MHACIGKQASRPPEPLREEALVDAEKPLRAHRPAHIYIHIHIYKCEDGDEDVDDDDAETATTHEEPKVPAYLFVSM